MINGKNEWGERQKKMVEDDGMDVGERQGKAVLKQDSDKGPPRCSNSKVPTAMDGGSRD